MNAMKMRSLLLPLVLFFLIISCFMLFYVFSAAQESLAILKAIFIYLILSSLSLILIFYFAYQRIYRLFNDFFNQYENIEKLLLDLRDGTKKFYKEKRKFMRVRNGITAKINELEDADSIKVEDISNGGALLVSAERLKEGQIIHLKIKLPLFAQPIEVRAKIVRVIEVKSQAQESQYKIGIEFIDMISPDKDKLRETVYVLNKYPH